MAIIGKIILFYLRKVWQNAGFGVILSDFKKKLKLWEKYVLHLLTPSPLKGVIVAS